MAVVLDAPVAAGTPLQNEMLIRFLDEVTDSDKCYMTLASVAEFACIVAEGCGEKLVEKWVGWLFTNPDIEIVERRDLEACLSEAFTVAVAQADLRAGLPSDAASAAALARRKRWPLVTDRPECRELEEAEFCQVRWPHPR